MLRSFLKGGTTIFMRGDMEIKFGGETERKAIKSLSYLSFQPISKRTGPEKKLLSQNNQNTKCKKKERILKAVRNKGQVTQKGRPLRIIPDSHRKL